MMNRLLLLGLFLFAAVPASNIHAQAEKLAPPAADAATPVLRLESPGPIGRVTALAFSPDGKTLYLAGFDKVVRVWQWDARQKTFVPDPARPGYRVPIGPGTDGLINVLAVSPDGRWLAASGLGVMRNTPTMRQNGFAMPVSAVTPEMWQDRGVIYLFDTQRAVVRHLRGHQGEVFGLKFAPIHKGTPLTLVSAAYTRGNGDNIGREVWVWDADRGKRLASYSDFGPPGRMKIAPGLDAWYDGTDLKVAMAWRDKSLHVWPVNAGQETPAAKFPDGGGNNIVAHWSGNPGVILTGGWNNADCELHFLDDQRLAPWAPVRLRVEGYRYVLPYSMCLVSTTGNGVADHAAIAAEAVSSETDRDVVLILLDLKTMQVQWTRVGKLDDFILPIAGTPSGRYLAVAAEHGRAIRLYDVARLVSGRTKPTERLSGAGEAFQSIAFVHRKGQPKSQGLALGRRAPDPGTHKNAFGPDAFVFDRDRNELVRDPEGHGWLPDAPPAGWTIEQDHQAPWHFHWQGPNQQTGTFDIHPYAGDVLRDYLLVPPRRAGEPPLLAAASWNRDSHQPQLFLYDHLGQPIRQYIGHTDDIYALALSGDGRYLASTGADRVTCVWDLAGAWAISGKHGRARGLAVEDRGKHVVVQYVDPNSRAAAQLKPGDEILGIARKKSYKPGDRLSPPASGPHFYDAFWRMQPGEIAYVNVAGHRWLVEVDVEQGVEDRKPLAFLFVNAPPSAPNAPRKPAEWATWDTAGLFDVSGPDAERFLGIQYNPEQPGGATRFAPARDYDQKFRRRDLFKERLTWGQTGDPGPVPRPTIEATVQAPDVRQENASEFLIRQPDATLDIDVNGPALSTQVASVRWEMDGKIRTLDLDSANGSRLSTPLHLGQVGSHDIRVIVTTREASPRATPQQVEQRIRVRYQRPAPVIQLDPRWVQNEFGQPETAVLSKIVTDPRFVIKAHVQNNAFGDDTVTVLTHNRQSREIKGGVVNETVLLKPGKNRISLEARNQAALRGHLAEETSPAITLEITRAAGKLDLVLDRFITNDRPDGAPIGDEPVRVVTAAKVRLLGHIRADAALTQASWTQNDLAGNRSLASGQLVVAGKREAALDQELTLHPGSQEFRLIARTAGDRKETRVQIMYLALPTAQLMTPGQVTEGEGKEFPPGQDQLPLYAHVTMPGVGAPPFKLIIHGSGTQPVTVPSAGLRQIKGDVYRLGAVALLPGENHIRVVPQNQFGEGEPAEAVVAFRRPPQRLSASQAPAAVGATAVELIAQVSSHQARPLTALLINGGRRKYQSTEKAVGKGVVDWTLRVTLPVSELPLRDGKGVVSLAVQNADGSASTPVPVAVETFKPRPGVAIIDPQDGTQIGQPTYKVRIRVESVDPLKAVRLVVENGKETVFSRDLKSLVRKNPSGAFDITGTVPVQDLRPGQNLLRLVAETEAGAPNESTQVLSYVDFPPVLHIDTPPTPAPATLDLTGHVYWQDATDVQDVRHRIDRMRVYVNGFRQRLAPADAIRLIGPKKLAFKVPLVLNGLGPKGDNVIEIESPGLRPDQGGRIRLNLACAEPRRPTALHLLVVGIGAENKTNLQEKALKAFRVVRVRQMGERGLRSAIFEHVYPYPSQGGRFFTDTLTRGRIKSALDIMRYAINHDGSPDDVSVIYWLGQDAVTEDGHIFLPTDDTVPGESLRTTAMPLDKLLEACDGMLGAQVLLFDLAHQGNITLDLPSTRSAVLREYRSQTTVPGMLDALRNEAGQGAQVSLNDLVKAAERLRRRYPPNTLSVFDNLKQIPPLDTLVVSGNPR